MTSSFERVVSDIKERISRSPLEITKICSYMRMISYVIPAKIDDKNLLSELLYSSSKVLEFLNEVIEGNYSLISKGVPYGLLTAWLNVVECLEVFIELAARQKYGEKGRWIIISCIQIFKAIVRLLLLFEHKSGVQSNPLLLKRCAQTSELETVWNEISGDEESQKNNSNYFKLKSCNKVVRKLHSAPPLEKRTWRIDDLISSDDSNAPITELTTLQTSAEFIHITRPICHLLSTYRYGLSSWKPWIFSLALDTSSLLLMGKTEKFTKSEKAELKRRVFLLFCYVLRSPFYDKVSKLRILFLLHLLSEDVPFVGFFFRPLREYLLYWQKIYSHVWMI